MPIVGFPGVQFLDYEEARSRYPHLFPQRKKHAALGGVRILSDAEEIARAYQELGIRPFMMIAPYGFFILHLVEHPNGRYGSHHQMGPRSQLDGRAGITAFPLWIDRKGVKRTCLLLHHRAALSWLPEEFGGGWELELPSFGERAVGIAESIVEELFSEARLRVVGELKRLDALNPAHPGFPLFPGISSHMEQVWLAPVEPLGETVEEATEGIVGRVLWTKAEVEDALLNGMVEIGGRSFLTTLAHNLVGIYWAALRGVW